jgi:transposase InsO family protein
MKKNPKRDRELAINRYLNGEKPATIARSLGYSRKWIYKWIERYEGRADGSDWCRTRTTAPHSNPCKLSKEMVETVKLVRISLYNEGVFSGAQAIRMELEDLAVKPLPSLRTINRILSREELTHRRIGRYAPKGKEYPKLVGRFVNEVHQMDFVGPCYLSGPLRFYSLNSVDLATGRCAINPVLNKAGQNSVDAIWSIWCRLGFPHHQQVDNEAVFYGSQRHPRGMGNLIRLCLLNDVEPWFIPFAEPWRNGVVEKFNDHYQAGFLRRVVMKEEEDLRRESLLYEHKHNTRYRYTKLQGQTPQAALEHSRETIRFPDSTTAPTWPLPKPKVGRYHLVRFIRSDAILNVFGEKFRLPPEATYEYAVATVDVAKQNLTVEVGGATIACFDYRLR